MRRFEREDRNGDELAAYAPAAWLQHADRNCSLGSDFNPPLTEKEREVADVRGVDSGRSLIALQMKTAPDAYAAGLSCNFSISATSFAPLA